MQEHIIHCLKKSKGYISGEEISRSANISRAAIWKYMQELRKDGYEIEAIPHLGYQLVSVPDKLLAHEIQFDLKTKVFGCKVFYHETLTSTMDEAFRLGMEGAPEGTVVCAEAQTKGRGRLGRTWSSPKHKGIYLSIILRPKLPPAELARLTLLSAVAVTEAVEKASGVDARIKWPNDILVKNKKLSGILTELRAEVDQMKFVVVGLGLNVNNTAAHLIDGATSLKHETGKTFSRVEVVQEILRAFERRYAKIEKHGIEEVIQAWKTHAHTLGKWVRITDPAGAVEGVAFDLDQDGGLLIRQDSGVVIKKMAGDVVQLR
jgi:BirA family transcriptional regulator, biotin operon repressor / biotin---[acetyl-CoA-carboxylase] ligase